MLDPNKSNTKSFHSNNYQNIHPSINQKDYGIQNKALISFNDIQKEYNYKSPQRFSPNSLDQNKKINEPLTNIENKSFETPINPLHRKSFHNSSERRRLTDVFSPPEKRISNTEDMHDTSILKKVTNMKSFACRSIAGSLDGLTAKTNQDGYIAMTDFAGFEGYHLFVVMDGHGNLGHDVTDFVKGKLPFYLEELLREKSPHGNFAKETIMQSFAAVFKRINSELANSEIDISLSGCTMNCIFIAKDKLYCVNIGDSRAIITLHRNYEWFVMPLSEDHKPELPREKERIEKAGGRVACMEDNGQPVGPLRVWLSDSMIPGLAMSRSLGDLVGKDAGIIADPDISCIDLTSEHKFVVLATDGLWEFISNEDTLRWVEPYFRKKDVEKAAEFLSKEALKNWKREDDVIDDITCILIYLNHEY